MSHFELMGVGAALGGCVGLLLALTGAGCGILAVPLLVFGLRLSVAQSAPIGLIAVGLAAALGAGLGLREGIVRYRAAALIGGVGMVLAPVGFVAAQRIPNAPLTVAFSFVMAFTAWRMYLRATGRIALAGDDSRVVLPCVRDARDGRLVWTRPCAQALAATGAISGALSGLLGVGGGFVIVPALTKYTDLTARSIVATSLAVIALVSVGGVGAAAVHGTVDWSITLPFAAGAVVALLIGRKIASHVAGPLLQQCFAAFSAIVAILLFARGMGYIGLAS
jgi:uncharacterized membrane protein YfcA